jgi:N6-adenosine-specific RNA methylase IME4
LRSKEVFESIRDGAPYSVIYCDPPWLYKDDASAGDRGAVFKYPCMSAGDLQAMPVRQLAAEPSVCLMWCTPPMMQEGLDLMAAWGFEYQTIAFTWIKTNKKKRTLFMGMGRYTRANAEHVLLGTIDAAGTGNKLARQYAGVHSVVLAPVMQHSRKPAEVAHRIDNLFGDVPRVELFARRKRAGWRVWGNDV